MNLLDYITNQEEYIHAFKMKSKSGKIRTIITYANNEKGRALREKHVDITHALSYLPSYKYSYAYKKGICTKDALKNHFGNKKFIKLDIHNFFESITKQKFDYACSQLLRDYKITMDISPAFYKDHLILGFVTSPMLSDIYMYNFDMIIDKYLSTHKGFKYSRYSDDILISSNEKDSQRLIYFAAYIEEKLKDFGLSINSKKTREYNLNKVTSVSYLGLNLSYKRRKPRITLSKKSILKAIDLYKDCRRIVQEQKDLVAQKNDLVYVQMNTDKKLPKKEYNEKIDKIYKDIRGCEYRLAYTYNNANSMVSYIKYNSKDTFKKFKKKFKNVFKTKYGFGMEDIYY